MGANASCEEEEMARKLFSSGSPYEPIIGFSRAVRVGNVIAIGGTAPIGPDGKTVSPGDPAAQARRCYEIIQSTLEEAGAGLEDVVRTRTLLKRIEDWQTVAEVRAEYFRDIRPAETVMQVTAFVDPDWLVEIEADVVVDEGAA
jgi:enamine deaminase RidA (YjgF/YER057c/UK114 family)